MIQYIKSLFVKDKQLDTTQKSLTVQSVCEMMRPDMGGLYTDATSTKYYEGWVYAASTFNAKQIADARVKLVTNGTPRISKFKRINKNEVNKYVNMYGELNEIENHPIIDLLVKPNETDTNYSFLYKIDLFLEITGDAYILVTKENNIPVKLEVLYSQFVDIQTDGLNRIIGYNYGVPIDGKYQYQFKPEEIIHMKFFNPDDILYGMAPLKACSKEVDLVNSMTSYEQALNRNLGIPAGILKYKNQVTDEARRSIESQFQKKFSSVGRAGKVLVTDDEVDFQSLGVVPRDMQFIDGRKITREEIFSCFGVPMSLLITDGVNRSNMQTSLISYHHSTILPRLKLISQAMTRGLVNEYPLIKQSKNEVAIIYHKDQPKDFEAEMQRVGLLATNKAITINELRMSLDLPALEDNIGNQLVGNVTLGEQV